MGASASTAGGELEELVACTYLLGQALASMSFPYMYRIHDFHSSTAPSLCGSLDNLDMRRRTVDEEFIQQQSAASAGTFDYGSRFNVMIQGDRIVIDDVTEQNEDGWTPLHACCHSHSTVGAALQLIEEYKKVGASFEQRTRRGPGAYNSRWTALHMAAAYGIEPIVSALLEAGADASCRNSLGWMPLHEACHRGFFAIAKVLVAPKDDRAAALSHVPPDAEESSSAASSFPFARPPPQSPLGEAARCGFLEIVTLLLDAGAPKDLANAIGWTPLHEAAFYNHVDVVKSLLVYGVDARAADRHGATAYHAASSTEIRDLIRDLGGPGAATDPPDRRGAPFLQADDAALNDDDDDGAAAATKPRTRIMDAASTTTTTNKKKPVPAVAEAKDEPRAPKETNSAQTARAVDVDVPYLHRGDKLGDLPTLTPLRGASSQRAMITEAEALRGAVSLDPRGASSGGGLSPTSATNGRHGSRRRQQQQQQQRSSVDESVPADFRCAISEKLLKEPVRSPYGHVFETKMIRAWFAKNGSICPMTGQPLVETELRKDADLKARIDAWHVNNAMQMNNAASAVSQKASTPTSEQTKSPTDKKTLDQLSAESRGGASDSSEIMSRAQLFVCSTKAALLFF